MFPEFRDLISTLKTEDAHFARLFQRHNELDHEINNKEAGSLPADGRAIETLKKEKLLLKDKLYVVLKRAATPA
ncbi:YdcH family protein [Caballeronia sp. SEWSISQ10-4 2]|uniref:YdcH family protein n=1 Tax=Caballeronia sp. SEWSISQ10-4 2 TaxID=2937438 RepID=UPI00264DF8F2|nr:YdcH family protein [Caballeronia sp. SEWSISQ10-4 2]MDN7183549.1 YdcH family protein [Caballeronia sp. SEWSISQ10-4 2]